MMRLATNEELLARIAELEEEAGFWKRTHSTGVEAANKLIEEKIKRIAELEAELLKARYERNAFRLALNDDVEIIHTAQKEAKSAVKQATAEELLENDLVRELVTRGTKLRTNHTIKDNVYETIRDFDKALKPFQAAQSTKVGEAE